MVWEDDVPSPNWGGVGFFRFQPFIFLIWGQGVSTHSSKLSMLDLYIPGPL